MKYVHHGGRATPLQHAGSCLSILLQLVLSIALLCAGTYFFLVWMGYEGG